MTTTETTTELKTITLAERLKAELTEFNKAEAAIEELKQKYGGLVIDDLADAQQVKKVTAAHKVVKKYRVQLEHKRVEVKQPGLDYCRDVDAVAKKLKGKIEPLELELSAEVDKVKAEKLRQKKEQEAQEAQRLQLRVDQLTPLGAKINLGELSVLTEAQFLDKLKEEQAAHAQREYLTRWQQKLRVHGVEMTLEQIADACEQGEKPLVDAIEKAIVEKRQKREELERLKEIERQAEIERKAEADETERQATQDRKDRLEEIRLPPAFRPAPGEGSAVDSSGETAPAPAPAPDLETAIKTVSMWATAWADEQADVEDPNCLDAEEREVLRCLWPVIGAAEKWAEHCDRLNHL